MSPKDRILTFLSPYLTLSALQVVQDMDVSTFAKAELLVHVISSTSVDTHVGAFYNPQEYLSTTRFSRAPRKVRRHIYASWERMRVLVMVHLCSNLPVSNKASTAWYALVDRSNRVEAILASDDLDVVTIRKYLGVGIILYFLCVFEAAHLVPTQDAKRPIKQTADAFATKGGELIEKVFSFGQKPDSVETK